MATQSSLERGDVYTRITNDIIQAIEAGAGEFKMPWHQSGGGGLPCNVATGHHYQGVNILALWSASARKGYASPLWATYLQWQALGAHVRRGEQASGIIFCKRREQDDDDEAPDNTEPAPRVIIRGSSVFNSAQVDGWQSPEAPQEDRTERLAAVDAFIAGIGATVHYGGDIAAYNPALDYIRMPERHRFVGTDTSTATESFYSVLLHEHVHWSGSQKRLNRDLSGRFGTQASAMEELVAEIGAAYLSADLGISVKPRMDHAAYVKSWLEVLREQNSAIVTASSAATAACRYLMDIAGRREKE